MAKLRLGIYAAAHFPVDLGCALLLLGRICPGYCYGVRNTWICLDDPANPELEADESVIPRDAVVYPAADNLPDVKSGVTGPIIAAVLAVVAVTIVLLWFFFVRKRRKG